MSTVDLLKLQQESGFYLRCVICGELIHPERLVRGADTCSNEHQKERRAGYNRFKKNLALQRVLNSPKARRLAIERERAITEGSSAPEVSNAVC